MKQAIIVINILLILTGNVYAESREAIISFEGNRFYVELAETVDEKVRGLMFREHLDPDKGMLFVYQEEGRRSFWMKNTLIPLDIIWIDEDKKAVFIAVDVQPSGSEPHPTINPDVDAKYVLELNAGTAEKIGLAVGDKLEFDIDQP